MAACLRHQPFKPDFFKMLWSCYLDHRCYENVDKSVLFPFQDACSSGSGESSELYNEGGTVPTTYIYNSSIFDQQSFGRSIYLFSFCNSSGYIIIFFLLKDSE